VIAPVEQSAHTTVQGQVAVATAPGVIESIALLPPDLTPCPEAVASVRDADVVVLGPGSWFSSVLPHLMVPALRQALVETHGHLVVVLNLAPQDGETEGYAPVDHLAVLLEHAPDLSVGTVLVDRSEVVDGADLGELEALAEKCGATVVVADIAQDDGSPRHEPVKLAAAYAEILAAC
jgi:uncharacterized cofD-like protein